MFSFAELRCPLFLCDGRYKTISKTSLINEEIRAKEVRLIDADGNQVGIVSLDQALEEAAEARLDLVTVAPNAVPPVCKIMDYGKHRYELQKKEKEARKRQKTIQVKEIRLGLFTEEHDLATKANNAIKFLKDGDKVKVSMRFRSREIGYMHKGRETMERFGELVEEFGTVEKMPVNEGRNMHMVLAPKADK